MEENNLIKEIIVEVAKENSKEVYSDLAKPALSNIGEILGTIACWFNNVAFYPVKKANLEYKYKLEDFARQLAQKVVDIPPNRLVEPPLRIAGPVLEALKYSYDEEELRDMYLNLLTSSMNAEIQKKTHPSFVEVIQKMSPLDAKLFKKVSDINDSIPCSKVTIGFEDRYFPTIIPRFFCPYLINLGDAFEVSRSLDLLSSLSLFDLFEGAVNGYNYGEIEQHHFIQEKLSLAKSINPGKEVLIKQTNFAIQLNDYGRDFAQVCVSKPVRF